MIERKLEIGAGESPQEGYEHLDIRALPHIEIVADARNIPADDNTFSEVKAISILEHFPIAETINVLKEWYRILVPGGEVHILVPNLMGIFLQKYWGNIADEELIIRTYGGQDYEGNFHYTGFTERTLENALINAGFVSVAAVSDINSIIARGVKDVNLS